MFLPDLFLKRAILPGRLTVIDADGEAHVYGDGSARPVSTVRIHDHATQRAIFTDPTLKVGEAYMDQTLTMEEGDLYDFLDIVSRAELRHPVLDTIGRWRKALKPIQTFNPARRSRKNVAHHYDLGDDLYALFLDRDWQYSCAYFESPEDDLDAAQLKKKRHIAAKLALRPGMRVLDIGCGWGGMALYLAEVAGAEVVGVTLSEEQLARARRRAEERGLADRAEFRLQDYRDVSESFDRIVSVGMFEHVGTAHFPAFFGQVERLLAPDGVALLHTIGRPPGPGSTGAFLKKYIFPGGYIPAMSEIVPAIERSGLLITDVEVLRLHYAETLRAWRTRFLANWDEAAARYDARFCRMWEFYLAGAETAFRTYKNVIFQFQLGRPDSPLPLTRGYMAEAEAALAEKEREDA